MKSVVLYCLLVMCLVHSLQAQRWIATERAPMPMPVTNNAVTGATVNGLPFVYSFGGIDSTKQSPGITLRAFRYDVGQDVWDTIAPLPDTLPRIAIGASTVKNKIYLIGGYHVFANGNEVSSKKVHIYDPTSNAYLPDGQDIPVAIDDQVQCVWRDSLVYVVTGWSNTTNVPNVQIYNPATDTWAVGTATPNNTLYKAFGANGVIEKDTIFYYGGASTANNFPAQSHLRKGVIDPGNPTQITWSNLTTFAGVPGYRMAATTDPDGDVHFLGGSQLSYNYNGIAYNGSGGVNPSRNQLYFSPTTGASARDITQPLPMDLRGIAFVDAQTRILAGGMEAGQVVSNKTIALTYSATVAVLPGTPSARMLVPFPNPNAGVFAFELPAGSLSAIRLRDALGRNMVLENWEVSGGSGHSTIYVWQDGMTSGVYLLEAVVEGERYCGRVVVR